MYFSHQESSWNAQSMVCICISLLLLCIKENVYSYREATEKKIACLLKSGLPLKERICSHGEQILSF